MTAETVKALRQAATWIEELESEQAAATQRAAENYERAAKLVTDWRYRSAKLSQIKRAEDRGWSNAYAHVADELAALLAGCPQPPAAYDPSPYFCEPIDGNGEAPPLRMGECSAHEIGDPACGEYEGTCPSTLPEIHTWENEGGAVFASVAS